MRLRGLAVLLFAFVAVPLSADTFSWAATNGNWSNTSNWLQNGVAATRYPGQLAGTTDVVNITTSLYSMTMDVPVAEPVTLTMTCPSNTSTCIVDVVAGGLLKLTGASTVGSDSNLRMNGGGIANLGSLSVAVAGDLFLNSGTFSGIGSTTISFHATTPGVLHLGGGTISGEVVNVFGLVDQTNGWSLNNSGVINIKSGGKYILQAGPISTNTQATSAINNSGTFQKTGGGNVNIDPPLSNGSVVDVQVPGALVLGGAPTHTNGTFNLVTGSSLEPHGTFAGTCNVTGNGSVSIIGTPMVANGGTLNMVNVSMNGGWLQGPAAGSASANVSGILTFNGGVVKQSITLTMQTGSTFNFPGTAGGFIDVANVIINIGAVANISAGPGSLGINSGGKLINNGTVNLLGDVVIGSDNAPGTFINNQSTVNKPSGAGAAIINCTYLNIGSTSVTSGILKLRNGGNHSGPFFVGTPNGIAFDGGTHSFTTGAAFNGTGTYALTAGVMDVDSPLTVSTSFQQSGGTLTGSSSFQINGPFLWTAGVMDNSDGNGATVLGGSAQIASTTSSPVISGRTVQVTGTLTYNPSAGSELFINNGGELQNTNILNLVGDAIIKTATPAAGTGLYNAGTINKSTGAGSAVIFCWFHNVGTLNISSSSVTIKLGGGSMGTINVPNAGNKLIIDNTGLGGGNASVIGSGSIVVSGLNGFLVPTAGFPITLNNLELIAGGTINGGDIFINNSLLWKHGTFNGPGNGFIAAGATVNATSLTGALQILNGYVLENDGTFTWDGGQSLALGQGSVLKNDGTFNATGAGNILGSAAEQIVNNGTFKKTGTSSGTRIDVNFSNNGSMSSEGAGQALIVNGGGSQSGGGSLNVAAGALLDFFGGTFVVNAGTAPFQGSGTVRVNGGILNINGTMAMGTGSTLEVRAGTLAVGGGFTFDVPTFQWLGGILGGSGTTRVSGGSIPAGSLARSLINDHTLSVVGTVIYGATSPNIVNIIATAAIAVEPGGTLQFNGLTAITGSSPDGLLINGGTVSIISGVFLNSGGTMSSGAMNFSGGVQMNMNIFDVDGGTITNGHFTVAGATLNINTNPTLTNLTFSSGVFGGTGAVIVNGGSWSGGTMTGSGSTAVNGGASFNITGAGAKTLSRALVVQGGGTVNASSGFTVTGAGSVLNSVNGIWHDMASSVTADMICSSCTGRFHNDGAFIKEGPNFTEHTLPFDNDGTFTNDVGTIGTAFLGGGVHTGDFATGTGNIWFGGGHTFSATSDSTGQGFISFRDNTLHQGTINLTGTLASVSVGPDEATSTLTLNTAAPVNTPRVLISGNINGTGAINGTASSAWFRGTLGGTGAFTIAASGNLFIMNSAGSRILDGRTITNNGTLNVNGTLGSGPAVGSVINAGTFRSQPTAAITFGPPVTNQATAQFISGAIALNGGYTQTAGATQLLGGTFSSPLPVNIDGGVVTGNGTITADVSNDGAIGAGNSPGTITIAGNYAQSASGSIIAEIGGNTPGTGYDQLVVTGNATLNGTINIALINGFQPADADTFDLVTWGSRTGTFSTVNLPPYPEGTLTPSYEPNAFRITADTVGDLAITKTGPPTAVFGQNVTFTVQVTNNGPSPSSNVTVADPLPPNLTFVSNTGDCVTAFPCSLGTVNTGQTKTITSTYTVTGGAGTNITNTATVSSTSTDSVTSNNSDSATVFIELADLGISKTGPARANAGANISFTIVVANGGTSAAQNVVVSDPTPAGLNFLSNSGDCTTAFPCNLGTIAGGATRTIIANYSVSGTAAGSTVTNTATVTTTTTDNPSNNSASASVAIACLNTEPDQLEPTGNAAAAGTLSWRGRGQSYIVYFGPVGSGCETEFARTTSRSVPYSGLQEGATYEWRVESLDPNCRTFSSSCVTFSVPRNCVVPGAPLASVVGQTTSAKTYEVTWEPVPGAVRYEIDESSHADFRDVNRIGVTGTSHAFKHEVTLPTAFYYRVRAFTDCVQTPGPFSPVIRVIIIPLPPKTEPSKRVNVPVGSEEIIIQEVFIPGEEGQNLAFSATTDRPWLTVRPAAGIITPAGVTLEVLADPKNLPNGTFTASVIVVVTSTEGNVSTNANTTTTVPISVNLVTPVTPIAAKPAPSQYALIIPTVGHLGGIDSQWQSDVRVTNAGFKSARYRLTFTPSGGTAQGVKQTTITVDAGATTALDDIIANWFGLGTLGDGANGMLEILPLDDPANTALVTVASSRTYNVSGNGTLGQYIPAVPFPNFIGRALPGAAQQVLSLQQIAQNSAYRTNVGLAEASGNNVEAVLSVFSSSGTKLVDVPVQLAAGEQRQLNQLLATHGIELADGRIEARVTGGEGKVTAYASVVDSETQDPLLVSGERLGGLGSTKFVLPGVANLDNQLAHWRTDMRVFNYGTTSQPAALTFFPFNNGAPKTANLLLAAGQVMTLDNILQSQFDSANTGGVVHLSTAQPASLVVTGRTYNQTDNGTFGQFVPAVTTEQAVGTGGRTLHILQVEDSTRYRTNVGVAEVTGKPVTVELQVILPDSKVTPTVQIELASNEFRQFNPIRELGVGNVYNARITVRVISGEGRVTAYGSVIDELTQDPTYVPAQ